MPGMPAPGMPAGVPGVPQATVAAPGVNAAGKKDTTLIETIILIVVCVIAAIAIVFAVIFFMQYNELNTNAESAKNVAVADAIEKTKEEDNAKFIEERKLPYKKFTGPSDYGSISFEYPNTWSVYIANDGTNNSDFVSYFRPSQVDPIEKEESRFALRFKILNQQITSVQSEYDSKLEEGEVTASAFNADNNKLTGTKYVGKISEKIDGIVVLIKVNDKTVVLQTDAQVYAQDFETLLTKLRRNS